MLERLQSALKTVKESKPSSMLSHRFVTVRRGSPAARSGQIQPGDQLEAVENRSVVALPHRDLAQILRRAGNTLRLTITPRSHTNTSNLSETAELETDGRFKKGPRGRSKQEPRFYSVDLDRGPTGFGFSLRGGSEYNMGLYVLGLMEGGPAQRSRKIQVSDQLVEINGDSTSGMTHSQAVEQIRRGGHRIHLVLKKGNGYVPDYDPEHGALSSSPPPFPEEQGVDPVTMTNASLSWQRGRGGGRERKKRGGGGRQRKGGSSTQEEGEGGRGTPDLDLDLLGEEEVQEPGEEQGVDSVTVTPTSLSGQRAGGGDRERKRRRGGRGRGTPYLDLDLLEEEEVQEEEERSRGGSRSQREQGKRAAQSWDNLSRHDGWVDGWMEENRGREKEEEEEGGREEGERRRRERGDKDKQGRREEREREERRDEETQPEPGTYSGTSVSTSNGKAQFSFLMPLDDANNNHSSDSESVASYSEVSLSAASIAPGEVGSEWKEHYDWHAAELSWQQGGAPGPWLKPSQQRLTQILSGSRFGGRDLGGEAGLSL